MTWNELVREYIPDADEALANYILWNETSFPLGEVDEIRLHVAQFACNLNLWCGGPYPSGDELLERGAAELEGA